MERRLALFRFVIGCLCLAAAPLAVNRPAAAAERQDGASATGVRETFRKPAPEGLDDLLAIERRVTELAGKLKECTVAVQIGRAQGSGVIISEDGYVLTAAHVSGGVGRSVSMILADGRAVQGKSLGLNATADGALIKIDGGGKWPFAKLAEPGSVQPGDWCIATGHPEGRQDDRPPVLRLGRVVGQRGRFLQTECTLVGGDSGGPLFDLDGRVIGIHSRIANPADWNFHVPADFYSKHWDRLVRGDAWDESDGRPLLGINGDSHPDGVRISGITPGYPAEAADLRAGDIVVELDGKPVADLPALAGMLRRKRFGDVVTLAINRGGRVIEKQVELKPLD